MKMETFPFCWLSSVCSSRMATDKSALSLSIGCSTADAGQSCSCPVERGGKNVRLVDSEDRETCGGHKLSI